MKMPIDKKYRNLRAMIASILKKELLEPEYEEFYQILENKNDKIQETCKAIHEISEGYGMKLNGLLSSHIHMLCNRLFISNQRFHEFVIYYLLAKHYKSTLAQLKYKKK